MLPAEVALMPVMLRISMIGMTLTFRWFILLMVFVLHGWRVDLILFCFSLQRYE